MAEERIATVEPGGRDVDDIDGTRGADRAAPPRHPAAVTIDRLGGHVERWADLLTPRELEAITVTMRALAAIERGER